MKPKNCLIFGASGQIGRNLIRSLTKNNIKVTALTRNVHQKGYILKTQANPGYLEIVEGSIFDHELIEKLFSNLTNSYPNIEFGAHFHTSLSNCDAILRSAYKSGCRRFDSTIKGFGGCPMANNDLVGNLPTEKLISFLENQGCGHNLSLSRLNEVVENFNYF